MATLSKTTSVVKLQHYDAGGGPFPTAELRETLPLAQQQAPQEDELVEVTDPSTGIHITVQRKT